MAGIVEDGNLKQLLFACCLLILITFYILYVKKKKKTGLKVITHNIWTLL